jgi:hypothetical protein
LFPPDVRQLIGPSCSIESFTQIVEDCFRDGNCEGLHDRERYFVVQLKDPTRTAKG